MQTDYPGNGLGTFWAGGPLSAMERACLASIVKHGLPITLFSYEPIANLPAGVEPANAGTIMSRDLIQRVIYDGGPNLTHFSDLFRYQMIRKVDRVWVDTDILMIADPPARKLENIIVKEDDGGINTAVLYLSDAETIDLVVARSMAKLDKELTWGETGPKLLTEVMQAKRQAPEVYDHPIFYPIAYYDMWKLFLPDNRDECAEKCRSATTIHLFNNIMSTMGYWKELAPPRGSFLHEVLAGLGLIDDFLEVYPEKIMRQIVENFRMRQNGKGLGIATIVREALPSIGRSYRHYRKKSA